MKKEKLLETPVELTPEQIALNRFILDSLEKTGQNPLVSDVEDELSAAVEEIFSEDQHRADLMPGNTRAIDMSVDGFVDIDGSNNPAQYKADRG